MWNEAGDLLAILKGYSSDGWHASHCLAFSLDSQFLIQTGIVESEGFLVLNIASGKTAHVSQSGTDLVAIHPKLKAVFATVAADHIYFWRLP